MYDINFLSQVESFLGTELAVSDADLFTKKKKLREYLESHDSVKSDSLLSLLDDIYDSYDRRSVCRYCYAVVSSHIVREIVDFDKLSTLSRNSSHVS